MNLRIVIITFLSCIAFMVNGQNHSISGKLLNGEEPALFANVALLGTSFGSVSDENGVFTIDMVPNGEYQLQVSAIGFRTITQSVTVNGAPVQMREISLETDVFGLDEVVVSGTRNAIERYNAPVIINTISNRTFEATQSLSIAEGLNFSPGLRVENNCQNCGFTQLRMNGLKVPILRF